MLRPKTLNHILLSGIFILTVLFSGCKKDDAAKTLQPLKLGVILPMDQDKGPLREKALLTAIDEINAAGGVGEGYKIELVIKSSAGADRELVAAAAAKELAASEKSLVGFVTSFSSCSKGVIEQVGIPDHYPLIAGAATAEFLSGISPYFQRLCPPDAFEANILTVEATKYGINSVAIAVEDGDVYSENLATKFQAAFGSGTETMVKFSLAEPAYASKIDQLLAGNPEAIFISMLNPSSYQEFVTRLSQLNGNTGPANMTFIFCDALYSSAIFSSPVGMMIGEINGHPRNFGAMPSADTTTGPYKYFQSNLMNRYQQAVSSYTAQFYDIGFLYAMALEKTLSEMGLNDMKAFRDRLAYWIRQVSHGNAGDPGVMPSLGWKSMKYACQHGGVDYQGASGNCNIDAQGNVVTPYAIMKIAGTPMAYYFETISVVYP